MEKVLGGPEGVVTVLVQQSTGRVHSLPPLPSSTKGGSEIMMEQVDTLWERFQFWGLGIEQMNQ